MNIDLEKISKSPFCLISSGVVNTLIGLFAATFLTFTLINANNILMTLMVSPFIICFFSMIINGTGTIIISIKIFKYKNDTDKQISLEQKLSKLKQISKKIYTFGSFSYMFIFLIIYDYLCIKEKNIILFVFSLLFWVLGIFALYKSLKK